MTVFGAHRLGELKEARGQLLKVSELEGFAVATFAWGAISLSGEMAEKLQGMMGLRVGIIRLDGYSMRVLDGRH